MSQEETTKWEDFSPESLQRARKMTVDMQKPQSRITLAGISDFRKVIKQFRDMEEIWGRKRRKQKVPKIKILDIPTNNDKKNRKQTLKLDTTDLIKERDHLNLTVEQLLKEISYLKQSNRDMATRTEQLKNVLKDSKVYSKTLETQNEKLTNEIDFQNDIHNKQRKVWKNQVRMSIYSEKESSPIPSTTTNLPINDVDNKNILKLEKSLSEFRNIIEKQREEIKYKNEQINQLNLINKTKMDNIETGMEKEKKHLKKRHEKEIKSLNFKIEQLSIELNSEKEEINKLKKTLEITNNELNATRKLVEARRPKLASDAEKQLFQLEQDYLTLSEVLATAQHSVAKAQQKEIEANRESENRKRLLNEQKNTIEQLQNTIKLLKRNLSEAKSDESDLIIALQQEWDQVKKENIKLKNQILLQQNYIFELKEELENDSKIIEKTNSDSESQSNNSYIEIENYKKKLKIAEDEILSQNLVIKELVNSQKSVQKQNNELISKIKSNKNIEILIDMSKLYEKYIKNPKININEMIKIIKISLSKIENKSNNIDFVINNNINIDSTNSVLNVIEKLMIKTQDIINEYKSKIYESKKLMEETSKLKENTKKEKNKMKKKKEKLNNEIFKLKNMLLNYEKILKQKEEEMLLNEQDESELKQIISKLQKENETIAKEYEKTAQLWSSEKAIMAAERLQIENDLSYLSHNLETLLNERQQYEDEAQQWEIMFHYLLMELQNEGLDVEIEYDKNVNNEKLHTPFKDLQINGITQRRQRRTNRIGIKNIKEQSFLETMLESEQENDKNAYYEPVNNSPNILRTESDSKIIVTKESNNKNSSNKFNKAKTIGPRQSTTTTVKLSMDGSESKKWNKRKDSKSIFSNKNEKMNVVQLDSINKSKTESNKSNINLYNEDEASSYIPFDEPDELDFLDEKYKTIGMKVIASEEKANFDVNGNFLGFEFDGVGNNVTDNISQALSKELEEKEQQLPVLQGWIEKRSPTFARGWQKRWVVVVDYNIFYSKNKNFIKNASNEDERKKFLNAIPLLVVQMIVATDHSKSGKKFEIVARDPRTGDRRHYQWKAPTKEDCKKWVAGLNEHKKILHAKLQFYAQQKK